MKTIINDEAKWFQLDASLFHKKVEYSLGGNWFWIAPVTLEIRIKRDTFELCIVAARTGYDDIELELTEGTPFYRSDVNVFEDQGSISRGSKIRLHFEKTNMGIKVFLVEGFPNEPMPNTNDISVKKIMLFSEFEMKLICSLRAKALKRLKSERK